MNKSYLIIFLFIFLIFLIIPTQAKTWYVDDDDGADFTSIGSAIQAADQGDTIYVKPGAYDGFSATTPYLNIIGESPDLVTVTGKIQILTMSAAKMDATGTVIDGFKCSNLVVTSPTMDGVADVVIRNCVFENGVSNIGPSVENATFEDNSFVNCDTPIKFTLSNTVNIINNSFTNISSTSLYFDNAMGQYLVYQNNNITVSGICLGTTIWNSTKPIKYTYNGILYTNYMGNYWSGYSGTDTNGDGISDSSYKFIIGTTLGTDYCPLMQPTKNYFNETPAATSIEVTPDSKNLSRATTFQFSARAFDQYDRVMESQTFSWSIDNASVGTINSTTGLFTPLAIGTATIKASSGNLNDTAQVTVESPKLTTIEISPSEALLGPGGSQQFTASAFDQDGNPMSEISFIWSSNNTDIGTVDQSGLFTAVSLGIANINATNATVSGSALVNVTSTDLIADAIYAGFPLETKAGNVNITVRNRGPVATGHSFNVTLLANNSEVGRNTVSGLENGESCNVTISWTPSTGEYGEVNLTAVVDPEGEVADSDTSNNLLLKKVTVAAFKPDLVADAINAIYPVEDVVGNVNITIENIGPAPSGAFNVTLFANNGSELYKGSEVNRSIVSGLESGKSCNVTISWTPSSYGEVNLTAVVDPEGAVADSDTSNNILSKIVTVTPKLPDLSISSVSFTNYPFYNNTLKATIENSGVKNAGQFNVAVVIGGNSTNVSIPELSGGNSTSFSIKDIKRLVNNNVSITVIMDSEGAITEVNETNNEYSKNVTISTTGQNYNGGRYSKGYDTVNTEVYAEGNVGVAIGISGVYVSTNKKVVTTRTFSANDFNIPAGATIKSARLYQGWTWYGDPKFNLQFNGHDTQEPDIRYGDCINGQNVFNVTSYFNATGNNTAVLTSTNSLSNYAYYATVLIVVYEADSEPSRQIWVNEGSDCLLAEGYGADLAFGYTMFKNVDNNSLFSAKITTILESGYDGNDGENITFNDRSVSSTGSRGSDPIFRYFDVTNALKNGENELGVTGPSYFNFANAVLQVTKITVAPKANFTADNVSYYSPLKVNFTDTSTDLPTEWLWEFGDGSNSTEQNPTHTYMQEGNYTVTLTVSNFLGTNTTTKKDYIKAGTFIAAPIADFSATTLAGDAPLTVEFTDKSISSDLSSISSWSWDFGDGKNSSEQNPQHIYESKGNYTVSLTVKNYGGSNTTTKTDYISVTTKVEAPIASFTTDSSSDQVPFTVQFTDTSTGSVSSWKWDFGDGVTSTDHNPTHTFVTPGEHTITLEATGPGGTNTTTGTITATAPLTSDSYNGGIPLTTAKTGTVSGGLWFDSYPGFATSAQKTFNLPTHTKIKWARLYVDTYCGHMESNYRGSATINIDANGDNTYELTKKETFNTSYSFSGADGTGPVWLSDHMNRVTSDYLMWYDLTDAISGNTVNVKVDTQKIDNSFDGRVKAMTLVVAYDDGDSDEVYYWVNQGHDTVNPLDTKYSGSTTFSVPKLSSGVDSANLSTIYYASVNGVYTFQGNALSSGTPSGSYYGDETWDISSMLSSGTNTLTYDKNNSNYFKIPLALMSVKKHVAAGPVSPTAGFSANITRGEAPLTVKFTDSSSGTPTSWAWDFDNNGTTDNTKQNPEHTYTTPGTYSVKLTVKNSAGSDDELKSDYITVLEPGSEGKPDLSISGVVSPIASTVFAREPNTIQIPIENSGFGPITNITVSLYASDISDTVPVATTNISSLEGQATKTVSLIDPAIRDLEGKTVTYTAKVDPENLIAEYNETNNNVSSSVKSVKYNGYKGKGIYWEGGNNITTKQTYDLRGDLIYSTQSESAYKSVGWKSRTETWNNSDLPIPAGTTVEKALLYISYNWDTTPGGVPDIATTFNGKTVELWTPYTDKSNFGAYADYKYGLYPAINVTGLFNRNGNNTLFVTPNSGNSNALYPSTLAVIYRDSNATRKLIFINEECDELAYSESSYGTTMEEATAYTPFTGLTLDLAKVQNATLHSFAGSAGPDEGNLFFNGESLATKTWTGTLKTASAEVFNVKKFLNATDNEAAVQGTESGGMAALQQFLVVEYTETAPVADFTTDINSGDAPLTVKFTDTSTGTPVSWAWDFDNDGFTDSEEQNSKFTYETPGNYTVTLTVTNPKGTDTETKEDYITVKKPVLPIANFSADRYTGTCPLIVLFKDLSERAEGWSWDFGDGSNSTEQNPTFTYETLGNYTVKLTVSNSYGTDSYTTEIVVKEFKSEEENYNFSIKEEIESINDTTNEIVINSSNSNVAVENNTIKVSSGKLNISIHTTGITGGKGIYTNATIETESETSDLGGNLSSVNTSLNATFSENLSALLQGNASITTTVVPGAPDNETESAFQLAGADFAEDMEIAYSLVINKSGLDGVTIKDAYISMTVPKVYVDSHGGTEAFVVMSLHEGKVTVLESSITEGGDYYIFTAYSPDGFSVKALMSYTPKTESESSHKSGGGGGSSEKLKIIPAETQVSSITESGEASTEEQESETEKMEITPVHEDKEDNKPASDVGNKNETESEGKIPGFEVPLVVFGGVLVFGMKRRRGEKRE